MTLQNSVSNVLQICKASKNMKFLKMKGNYLTSFRIFYNVKKIKKGTEKTENKNVLL